MDEIRRACQHSAGAALIAATVAIVQRWLAPNHEQDPIRDGIAQLVGGTPLVYLASLSEATGCTILAKAEFLNPGGSTKDRVALQVILDAVKEGKLKPGGYVVEGTSGSTGISLCVLARALGYRASIVVQDDVSADKINLLRLLGARVTLVPPVSIVNEGHYVNVARRIAEQANREPERPPVGAAGSSTQTDKPQERHSPSAGQAIDMLPAMGSGSAVFCDQFETPSNFRAHYEHTGPEVWAQTHGHVDAFVAGAGTGGTLAGVSCYLKEQKARQRRWGPLWTLWQALSTCFGLLSPGRPARAGAVPGPDTRGGAKVRHDTVQCFLVDPPGSSLLYKVLYGAAFAPQQAERRLKRHRYDTIIEGVGLDRVSANFQRALPYLDGAFPCTDAEAVAMARYLLRHEGLFVGSSSALCCVGAVKAARALGPGHTIVTFLCDSGSRHVSRFWNDQLLQSLGLLPKDVEEEGQDSGQVGHGAAGSSGGQGVVGVSSGGGQRASLSHRGPGRLELSFVEPLSQVWRAVGK